MVNFSLSRTALHLLLSGFASFATLARAETPPVTVFAAASLGDALAAISADWPGVVSTSLAGSGTIARQVDQGAPADVVFLANPAWMDWLDGRNALRPETRSDPISNTLVLVGPQGAADLKAVTPDTLTARLGQSGRLAMGEHRSVPAGQYAKIWLENQGLWSTLQSRLAETDNVRAALALVSRSETPLAILYASDLVAAPNAARIVWDIPASQQPDIRYSVAAVTQAGESFAAHLSSKEALAVFERFGFSGASR